MQFPFRIGIELMNEGMSWNAMREAVRFADELRLDSLWTWDHLLPINGPIDQPVFEAWATISAWAATTRYPTVGLMVGANTLRHPAVVAKAAVTVDHISNGRCILGLGAGSSELEHRLHGIPSGSSPGERVGWLEESVSAIRSLLAGGEVASSGGTHYAFAGVKHQPAPMLGLGRLRILIGGSGQRKTLPIVARFADMWNPGAPTTAFSHVRNRAVALDGLCVQFGRNPLEIERTLDPVIMIRPGRLEAMKALGELLAARGGTPGAGYLEAAWLGPPEAIAEAFRPYLEIGFTHLIAGLPAPYDRRTIEGLGEVRALLAGA